ncbi:MAG: [Fe-Fe] hydrogenase large subunit C-terminal domain-containing protein [Bacillota bacterium]|nr:[Fe-Fe] hydrogenase large subunit C-terminal domain-containing protein [Bacillota bacterium]
MPEIVVDGRPCEVPEGATILEAARRAGVRVPTLCHHPWLEHGAACGVCVVEVEGRGDLVTACDHVVEPGMIVRTATDRVTARRREVVSFLFAQHPGECLVCERRAYCELKRLGDELGVRSRRLPARRRKDAVDRTGLAIVRDPNKCVMCGRCVAACRRMHDMAPYEALSVEAEEARGVVERGGAQATIGGEWVRCRSLAFEDRVAETQCVECGQCVAACPTGALSEKSQLVRVRRSLADRRLVTVAQTAPALRATFAEAWGMPSGTVSMGRMVAALRKLGFDRVFDTAFGADLTAVEEAHELKERLEMGGRLPMFTSCCPAWVRFVENEYPGLTAHLSTCKSPHMMAGAVARAVLHEMEGVAPEDVYIVSMMPCTAKKFEAMREGQSRQCAAGAPESGDAGDASGRRALRDVDAVLTTRELIRLVQSVEMDYESLEDSEFDAPLGDASGAGTIFGTTGGVMDAALRVLADELGVKLEAQAVEGPRDADTDSEALQGGDGCAERAAGTVRVVGTASAASAAPGPGVAEATVTLGAWTLRVAVVQGLAAARRILEEVAAGRRPYDFVEVMACPGGCVGGGGQPIAMDQDALQGEPARSRGAALRAIDETLRERHPRRNPAVAELYRRFLGEPGGARARELLHDPARLAAQAQAQMQAQAQAGSGPGAGPGSGSEAGEAKTAGTAGAAGKAEGGACRYGGQRQCGRANAGE